MQMEGATRATRQQACELEDVTSGETSPQLSSSPRPFVTFVRSLSDSPVISTLQRYD